MQPLIISTIEHDFRAGGVFNFSDLPKIIYSVENTQFCHLGEIMDNRDRLPEFFRERFGTIPDAIVLYEVMYDLTVSEIVGNSGIKPVLITEDLNVRALQTCIKLAVDRSSVVLARFNIIEDLVGPTSAKVVNFPLHCADDMLGDPVSHAEERIVDFGSLFHSPNNIYPERSPADANHYQYRAEWKERFEAMCPDQYTHIRVPKEALRDEARKFSAGFACTYFPYNFTQACRDEQGAFWAQDNTPLKFDQSYFVAKFFEIPGAGLLLLADTTAVESFLEEFGFADRKNFLAIRPETAKETIAFLSDPKNKDKVDEIRANGNRLVKDRHVLSNRVELYQKVMADLLW
jgi:hypothetical protein